MQIQIVSDMVYIDLSINFLYYFPIINVMIIYLCFVYECIRIYIQISKCGYKSE